jgi:hypothetical protein
MRHCCLGMLLLLFFSCNKNNEPEPVCRFTNVTRAGGNLPVKYQGDTLMTWGEGNFGTRMFFNTTGRLLRTEEPVTDPYILKELLYNAKGQVTERKVYFKEGDNWVYKAKMLFTYTNNKITNIREESNFGNPVSYSFDLTWDGDNVASVTNPTGTTSFCTKRFSYDVNKANRMTQYSFLYFSDGDANYAGYKLPFYFSKNLVIKEESNCVLSEEKIFTYTFNQNGLVETMLDNGNTRWAYEYNCP